MKNRQYNYPPLGLNQLIGASTRPNELTYSEDWLRPDYIPPAGPAQGGSPQAPAPLAADPATLPPGQGPLGLAPNTPPLAAEAPLPTNPNDGLMGMMVPGAGS
jgi:phospholipid/cholesterol/gamma-HCH transport system substrate-binding protein